VHKKGAGTHMSNRNVKCIHEVLVHIPPKMMAAAAQVANAAFHSASGGTKNFVYICLQDASSDRAACKEFAMTMPRKLDKDNKFLRKIIFSKLHFRFWGN